MTIIGCMIPEMWRATDRIFCHFGPFFPFYPLATRKIKMIKKWKKTPGDIILHKCTKNHDHMLYCSWYMAYDRCNCYFSFWATFCPFNPLTAQKIKISKQWKQHLEILSFYTCVPEIMIRWYTVPEKWCTTDGWMDRQKKWHMRWVPHLKIEVTKYRTALQLFF